MLKVTHHVPGGVAAHQKGWTELLAVLWDGPDTVESLKVDQTKGPKAQLGRNAKWHKQVWNWKPLFGGTEGQEQVHKKQPSEHLQPFVHFLLPLGPRQTVVFSSKVVAILGMSAQLEMRFADEV